MSLMSLDARVDWCDLFGVCLDLGFLVAMHFVPNSFLLQVVWPGAPSSVLAPTPFCL